MMSIFIALLPSFLRIACIYVPLGILATILAVHAYLLSMYWLMEETERWNMKWLIARASRKGVERQFQAGQTDGKSTT